jgi:hypothetical protein
MTLNKTTIEALDRMEDRIKPLEQSLITKKEQRDRMQEDMKSIKKAVTVDILDMSKDKDVAKELGLTNQADRDRAVEERLEQDPEYMRLDAAVTMLEKEIALMQIDISFERRRFQVWHVEQLKKAAGVE